MGRKKGGEADLGVRGLKDEFEKICSLRFKFCAGLIPDKIA